MRFLKLVCSCGGGSFLVDRSRSAHGGSAPTPVGHLLVWKFGMAKSYQIGSQRLSLSPSLARARSLSLSLSLSLAISLSVALSALPQVSLYLSCSDCLYLSPSVSADHNP